MIEWAGPSSPYGAINVGTAKDDTLTMFNILNYIIYREKVFTGYYKIYHIESIYSGVNPPSPVWALPQVTLWDTGGLEKFRSMTRSYFHQLSALILVHSTKKDSSLEHLGRWIDQAVDEDYPPVLCVWTNTVDLSDLEEQRVVERVPHFASHRNIDARLCCNVCALSGQVESEGQTAVVDACNTLLDKLIQKCLEGSVSYNSASLEPAASSFMATRTSEPVRSEAQLLQLSEDAVDGAPRQRHRRCWKC